MIDVAPLKEKLVEIENAVNELINDECFNSENLTDIAKEDMKRQVKLSARRCQDVRDRLDKVVVYL